MLDNNTAIIISQRYFAGVIGFYKAIADEPRIGATHISLYMALFQQCYKKQFQSPFDITRRELMELAKISGRATYHKCMKDLVDCGFIKYLPSCNPALKSQVFLNIVWH